MRLSQIEVRRWMSSGKKELEVKYYTALIYVIKPCVIPTFEI